MIINIIAEIGSNWQGDIKLAKLHIKKAKESGATHVKFQMWRAEDLYNSSNPNWKEIKKSELKKNVAIELKNYADKIGINWFCSVFYPEAVEFLESIDTQMYKIASATSALKHKFARETIQKITKTKKQTFISTGFGGKEKLASMKLNGKNFLYTYCIAKYPALDNDIVWRDILNYDFFSDHTLGDIIPLTYIILKKSINSNSELFIEKHVKLNNSTGPDAPFSITFDDLRNLCQEVRRIELLKLPNIELA